MGQPALAANLASLKPLKERIAIRYDLKPLDFVDTARYILYRLKQCGAQRGIFTKEALEPLYNYSRGIPLKINNLCERSLLIGMMNNARVVNAVVIKEAIEDGIPRTVTCPHCEREIDTDLGEEIEHIVAQIRSEIDDLRYDIVKLISKLDT